jgi:pyruvate kinase
MPAFTLEPHRGGCMQHQRRAQGPEVRSGDLAEPVALVTGDEWTFTIKEGESGANRRISVNYDGFVDDVAVGDELLVDGGIMTFKLVDKDETDVRATARADTCQCMSDECL